MPDLENHSDVHDVHTSVAADKTFRVLIIEDNVAFRSALKHLLVSRFPHIIVEEAGTGKAALLFLKNYTPDIVFVDIKLPDRSGLGLIKRINALFDKIRVIVLTAYDSDEYRIEAFQIGATHFLVKGSTSSAEILNLVESHFSELKSLKNTAG